LNYYLISIIFLVVAIVLIAYNRNRSEKRSAILEKIDNNRENIDTAASAFTQLLDCDHYLSIEEYFTWFNKWNSLLPLLKEYKRIRANVSDEKKLESLLAAFEKGLSIIRDRNEDFIEKELEKYRIFFDKLEAHPLIESQRRAIVTDERYNLVVAGAGTGKTSTIVGKAGYIIEKKLAEPHEILLLSFARDARKEMEARVLNRLGKKLRVETFHSLGLDIISEVEGRKPSVSELSFDRLKLQKVIEVSIQKRIDDPHFLNRVNDYFLFQNTHYKNLFEFKSMGDYIDYLRNNQIRSLKGDLVKSFEECEIANYLYLNGVEYEYERNYEVVTASKRFQQYKPDFYLPEFKIYIEHFGINRNGETAPFVDREKYREEMAWKQRLHKENHTKLIETYSWWKSDEVLVENLEKELVLAGVKFRRIDSDKIFEKINSLGLVSKFTNLVSTFLTLYKNSGKTINELIKEARSLPDASRYLSFLDLFAALFTDYEKSLGKDIDFPDMISKAGEYVDNNEYKSDFKYILVDEFQDTSYARYRLLKALVSRNQQAKLFAVGDDWQSIYRFTGSDISIMTDFDSFFSPNEKMSLEQTFRFNNKIGDFSSKFILKNPRQLRKKIKSMDILNEPSVSLFLTDQTELKLNDLLSDIDARENDGAEVYIIGRYNHQRPNSFPVLVRKYPDLSLKYMTAHSSKGTEADYVIIIGLTSEGFAFPSQIVDDPILDLVLSKKEGFSNAEERRLFYVAVTRAKKHVFLISSERNPSLFSVEIERDGYEINHDNDREVFRTHCPICTSGFLVLRKGRFGEFYSCSNFPYCTYKPRMCPRCGVGFLREGKIDFMCTNDECSFVSRKCPECKDGFLVVRDGPYSKFLGCINFPDCTHTQELSNRRYRREVRN